MATNAIITADLKHQLLDALHNDLVDSNPSNYYYVGIAKSDQWDASETVPTTKNTPKEERDFRSSLQSMMRATDASYVSPRYDWSSGTIYSQYSDTFDDNSQDDFYVLTENNRVYMCMQQGKDSSGNSLTSTIDPDTLGNSTTPVSTADGYVWKYMYTLSANQVNKFLSADLIPVRTVDSDTSLTAAETSQLSVQNAANAGEIVGFRVVSGGVGYTSTPTIEIEGPGTGARASATVSIAGNLSKIEIDESDGTFFNGSGYDFASVKIVGGSPTTAAQVEPIISKDGIGKNPTKDLLSSSVMINVKPDGSQSGTWLVDQDFRQIGLIKNPITSEDSTPFTGTTASALKRLTLSGIIGFDSSSAKNTIIEGQITGAQAYVDEYIGGTMIYHQNENTGFLPFDSAETIFDTSDVGNTASIVSDSEGTIQIRGGEILYIENRSPVVRDAAQSEDIKIIVTM